MISDDNFYYTPYKNGYIIRNNSFVKLNGLKNYNLIDCVIPKTFEGKRVYGFGYRCFHSGHSIVKVFIPNTINYFNGDTFANCTNLTDILFEDGFHNVVLSSYLLYATNITSFKFPIGTTIKGYSFAYTPIRDIYIYDFMTFNNANIFIACSKSINIYVPENYPYDSFGGRPVSKILPSYTFSIQAKGIKIVCVTNQLYYITPFVFLFV